MKKLNRNQLRKLIQEISTRSGRPQFQIYGQSDFEPESPEARKQRLAYNQDRERRYHALTFGDLSQPTETQEYLLPLVQEALRQIGYSGGQWDTGAFNTSMSDDNHGGRLRTPVLEVGVPGENDELPLVYIGAGGEIILAVGYTSGFKDKLLSLDLEGHAIFV